MKYFQFSSTAFCAARTQSIFRCAAAVAVCFATLTLSVVAQDDSTDAVDEISQQASALEAELGKYKDTAPEAGDVLIRLTSLYYDNGLVFGLVRSGQRFVSAHPSHPRHSTVMLQLMDGLEALSRNREFTVIARQFLSRYPKAAEGASVEERLAAILEKLGEKQDAAEVYQSRWQRQANPQGRKFAEHACRLYSQSGNDGIALEATLAEEMFDRLPKDEYAKRAGLRAYAQWRRISKWAEANTVGNKLLRSGLLRDAEEKREVLRTMADNYGYTGQHSNAVEMLKQARKIRDDQLAHYYQIQRMYDAALPAGQLEPVVKEYLNRYKNRDDRYERVALLAVAWNRDKNQARALQLFRTLLSAAPEAHNTASLFIQLNGSEPAQLQDTEKALREAIAKNPKAVWVLRYQLAFSVYRDRMKDIAKAKQMAREFLQKSPTNDGYSWNAISFLLSGAESDAEFRNDLNLIATARRNHIHWSNFRQYPGNWAKNARRNKDLKARVDLVQARLQQDDKDQVVALVQQIKRGPYDARDAQIRTQLLEPRLFNSMPKDLQRYVLWDHGYYHQHYAKADQRGSAATWYSRLVKMYPENFEYRYRYLQAASDYSPPEVAKEAALTMMSVDPPTNNYDVWRRLLSVADRNEDADLVRRTVAYIRKSHQLHGKEYQGMTGVGNLFEKLKQHDDAVAIWKETSEQVQNLTEARDSAGQLFQQLEDPAQRSAFAQKFFAKPTPNHGRYAMWLADSQLRAGNLDQFEKTLRESRKRADDRPFETWDADPTSLSNMLYSFRTSNEAYRTKAEEQNTPAEIARVATVVRDMQVDWPSAQGELMLLEELEGQKPMERALAWQRVTRKVAPDSHRWDQLVPFAQRAITREDYSIAATLLTGMLENISAATESRKEQGRAMIGQCYTRLGTVGLTIDESSPIAPLLRAALYLRLGDENLALETWLANRELFDQHRLEVPVDLLIFVCDNLMAAGGDENHNKVEDTLRTWIIKNSESESIQDATKAEIQFLLAKNFYTAKRFDVARSEYTTVMNRYSESPFAVEAEFGIGETYMAQKVYDQAETVFEKLANSRDPEIIVRAEFLRGVLSHRRGDNDEARKIFRNVLERVPNIDLANKALFSLSEVYGDEERYMDQLQLLMTVGRLGRVSKRQHAPGLPLSIVVQDSDLGISRGHNRVPVIVRTEPGNDEELIYLSSGGAGKGVFRADVDTLLGPVAKGDGILQLTGNDVIRCDYPEEFKSEFKSVPLSDVEIRIASDAEFKIASSVIIDEKEETFSERLEREAREREQASQRQADSRPSNQIKPGNPIYLRVKDADRDLGDERDTIVAKLVADSGDQVQVSLTETEPHSGIFEGTAKSGELPAGALASDTAIDHSPLMAIDKDPASYWQSEPDGATPKSLTVDMKDLRSISRAKFTVPEELENRPVRAALQASYDGEFWYRVAGHPAVPEALPVAEDYGQMSYRLYGANTTSYTTWQQVLSLAAGEPMASGAVEDGHLEWVRPEDKEDTPRYVTMIWYGKFVQPRPGAVRFSVQGYRTAIAINGRLESTVIQGNQTVDVWLEQGVHDLTFFASAHPNTNRLAVSRARSDLNQQRIALGPFLSSDFDLTQPAAQIELDEAAAVAPAVTLGLADVELQKKTAQFGVTEQGETQVLGSWQDLEDRATWTSNVPAGVYDVWFNWSHGGGGGSRFTLSVGESTLEGTVTNTGSWQKFQEDRVGTVIVDSDGELQIGIKPDEIVGGGLMGLAGIELRPATGSRTVVTKDAWEFRFDPVNVRYTRFLIEEYLGEAVAVSHVEISGDDIEKPYIPTEADVLALSQNDVLEIAGGDIVNATYTDEVTQANSGGSRLLTDRLQATYFDAEVSPIAYTFVRGGNGAVNNVRKRLKRVDPGERLIVEIVDYDRDQTSSPDQVLFEVSVNDGEPIQFAATETEEYSGIFTKEVDTSAKVEEGKLTVKRGDRIYLRYYDEQNTFPGHSVPREDVVYVNEPTDAKVQILESRAIPVPEGRNGPVRVTYQDRPEEADVSSVAFEAPLTVEVIDPDAAKDSLSEVVVSVITSDGAKADVRCVISGAFSDVPNSGASDWALEEGRFIGQVVLQLGSKTSPEIVPVTPDMPRGLIGGGVMEDEEEGVMLDDSLVTRVLNLTGKDEIRANYLDEVRTDDKPQPVDDTGRLISNGVLACTDRDYDKPITQLHVGEKLYLVVTDADQDSSDERDSVELVVTTEFGEKETVTLVETLVHSGVFTGSFTLKSSEEPTAGNLQPGEPEIECYFGDTLHVAYVDAAASSETGTLELSEDIPVVIGTDGLVAAFSKTFNNEKLAVETKFHIAESYFELFKSHRELGRSEEERVDLDAGRRILREVMEDYPDPKYVPRVSYLLGQFAQELASYAEAIDSYEMIVRQFPDHPLAADAQYKLAQSYEEAGDFDEALESYVTLAATYPRSPLIASVMIRICDYFYKAEEYDIAAQVGEKFLERFEGHQHAARIAFRIGQCSYKAEEFRDAGLAFDRFSKLFPEDDLAADALFWSGESYRMANDDREAFRRYNRCRWDFPESESARYSRGRLALPEMLQQFEADARSVEDQ